MLEERGEAIGRATNNVAEYRALLLGIERALALGASELELVGDSELVVEQVKGEYKVKDASLRALHAEVEPRSAASSRWSIRHVRREQNAEADRLVNEALDRLRQGATVPATRPIDPRRRHRPRPPQGRRPRPRARLLLRRARLRAQQRFGDEAAFVSAGGYHHHIGLNTWHSKGGSPPPPGTTGLFHTAILYPTRRDLADALRRLREAGIPLDGASDHGVSEALYLRDPDGNGVELYWDRPREEWPRDPSDPEGVAMFTAPLDLADLLAELD